MGAVAAVAGAPAVAGDYDLPAHQFGKFPKALPEKLVSVAERLLHGEDPRYEPVAGYALSSRLWRLGNPVGLLDILVVDPATSEQFNSTCTASIISSGFILTNWHCIPGDEGAVVEALFVPNYYNEADTENVQVFRVDPDPVETGGPEHDYSILRVEGDPAAAFGTVRLSTSAMTANQPLIIFHHPLGFPKQVTRFGCKTAGPNPISGLDLIHKCDTKPGSSGAPVLLDDSETMVALHRAGGGARPVNLAILISEIAAISPIIRDLAITGDGGTAAAQGPSVASIDPLSQPTPQATPPSFLDPAAVPRYGTITLDAGFTPDPTTISVQAGGRIAVADLGPACAGFVNDKPDLNLFYEAGSYDLTVAVDGGADTTLAILDPAEEWYCSDDFRGINPGVVFADPLSGGYRIWVGTFVRPGEYPSVELQVTERDISQTAALPEPPVPGLAPDGEPYYGVVALTAGFEPDPHGINLRAGGTVAVADLGEGCAGFVNDKPDYAVDYTAGSFDLTIHVDGDLDTTLVVLDPAGQWHCNDDFRGESAGIVLGNPASGTYRIWVGTFSRLETMPHVDLMITERELT